MSYSDLQCYYSAGTIQCYSDLLKNDKDQNNYIMNNEVVAL
jgi:hypothetical protein